MGSVAKTSVAEAARSIWAKSRKDDRGNLVEWLPLWRHLDDSAAVAGRLWDRWLPPNVKDLLAAPMPMAHDDARVLLTFLAGVHDIGKASPAFAVQMPELRDRMREAGFETPISIPTEERRRLPHGLAGEVVLERWLVERYGWPRRSAHRLGSVVGGHHGIPPEFGDLERAAMRVNLLGAGLWVETRSHLLERMAVRARADDRLGDWSDVVLPQPAQVLISALVIVSDWIASSDLFPLVALDRQPGGDDDARLDQAWNGLELPGPWRPTLPSGGADQTFRGRFDLPVDAVMHPVQELAYDMSHRMDVPGLMIIEAPMGEGKTEAALLAAEVLAARSGAGGCFLALPTQATTDAMFSRVMRWLHRVPDAEVSGPAGEQMADPVARSVMLAHGKAALNATFRELGFGDRVTGVGIDLDGDADREPWDLPSIEASVSGWARGRKRGALADFVVGTIDQLLFTSLRARHLVLRHLGMARKVVVIDEVHGYDAYMDVYLTRSLTWLGAYGVPVVMLSATLPSALRRELTDAYRRGRDLTAGTPDRSSAFGRRARRQADEARRIDLNEPAGSAAEDAPVYPAVTVLDGGAPYTERAAASPRSQRVRIEPFADDLAALTRMLVEGLAKGGCAVVIRNTVRRAQETADALSARFGEQVRLVHARFIGHHRSANDTWLAENFGPPSSGGTRPYRSIVVATQVVEQSLDVDFDLLVTDLAPTDLLLQRIGRLHRHPRGYLQADRPARLRQARCLVTGVDDWGGDPVVLDGAASAVYDDYLLLRAAAQVRRITETSATIVLPDDIALLVQEAYGARTLGPTTWQPTMEEAAVKSRRKHDEQEGRAETFRLRAPSSQGDSLLGWLHAGVGEADDGPGGSAQVRDGESTFEVLLLRRSPDGQIRIPEDVPNFAHEPVPLHETPGVGMARAIAGCAIRLPRTVCVGSKGDALIDALQRGWEQTWQRSPLLAGQLVLPVDDGTGTLVAGSVFSYDRPRGLDVRAAKES